MAEIHVVTVWWRRGGEQQRDDFTAPHIRAQPLRKGWVQVELCDENWQVIGVEQLRADRVSIRRTGG